MTDATGVLSAQLMELLRRAGPLPCSCVRALSAQMVRNYELDGGLVAIPLRGKSRISDGLSAVEAAPGDVLVVPNARSIDWEQFPQEPGNEFFAIGVVFDESLVEVARRLIGESELAPSGRIGTEPLRLFVSPLSRWVSLMCEGNRALALHAIVEVIIRLHELGHAGILRPPLPGLAPSIRKLVTERPSHDWQSAEFEEHFLLSGPTLRRRLSQEGTTLRRILLEARMAHGLHLLLTTSMPVKTVAARAGYESPSSFSRRFSERYGLEPAELNRR